MMRLTLNIPDDLTLLVDEYRKGQPAEPWVLDAIERKIRLLKTGVLYRRVEEVDLVEEIAKLESRLKGTS